jgi:HlyD family secretion protein
MVKFFLKIKSVIIAHKIISVLIIAAIAYIGYWGYGKFNGSSAETRYVLAAVQKGTLITSVSGSGQISASDQVDIKSKASGDVIFVGVKNGQIVKTGTLLAQLDSSDAQKKVRDARSNLENAQLSLSKLVGLDSSSTPKNKQDAQANLKSDYDSGFNTVANAFLDLPTIMTGLQDILFSSNSSLGSSSQWNIDYYTDAVKEIDSAILQYRDDTNSKYQIARTKYDKNFQDYKSASRFSDSVTVDSLINETYDTAKSIAEAVKSANNLIQFYKDKLNEKGFKPQALADTHLASLNTYTGKTNSQLLSLLSIQNTIKNDKDAILNADLDIQSQQLSVKQKEDALQDAQDALSDYYIRAPFDGMVAKIDIQKGDSLSSGSTVATFITAQKIAEITLNEVDVAKVKVGQKATLTFDAIDGLTITGQVADIDNIGTVSQGVVSYGIKIVFDTQDARVKPGMSVSAAIITDTKTDVLLVPNSVVKSQGDMHYVEMLGVSGEESQQNNLSSQGITSLTPPKSQMVEIGSANDSMTEITSGLKEGDLVIVRTISASSSSSSSNKTSQQNSNLRIPGLSGGGMGR